MNCRTTTTCLPIVILCTALLIESGCSSLLPPNPDLTRFYLLASLNEMGTKGTALAPEPALSDLSLGLGPIQIPGYLDRDNIVTRVSPNRLTIGAFDRWAEPLESGLYRVLKENLTVLLGTKNICTYPFSRPDSDYEIQIDVVRFEPTGDHSADLVARWSIKDGRTRQVLLSRDSNMRKPARSMFMAGSVGAMSEALGELSSQIATAIHQLRSQAPVRPRSP